MSGQTSIYDFLKMDPPQVWDCMKTCRHADEHVGQFPLGGKLCEYGQHQPGIGTSGLDLYERIKDNVVTFYCKFYEMR